MLDMKAQKLWKSWIFKVRWLTDKNFGYGGIFQKFCMFEYQNSEKKSDIFNSFLIILSNKPNII